MPRISELHYSNAYASSSGVAEFLEVSLGAAENPAHFTASFYNFNGVVGIEIPLNDPGVTVTVDPDNGEVNYVISASAFPLFLTDPDAGATGNNYEAFALTNTVTGTVIDFYDIGGGTQNILATNGLAAGQTSVNLPVLTGPNSTTTTLQFNQPNPGTLSYETVGPGDTGPACFAAGTLIDTDTGPRAIEELAVGDRVCTLDHGVQPIVWVGAAEVDGRGGHGPVRIRAGTLGATRDVYVSPQHRLLIDSWQSELLFGHGRVFIPAMAAVNGTSVTQEPLRRNDKHTVFSASPAIGLARQRKARVDRPCRGSERWPLLFVESCVSCWRR